MLNCTSRFNSNVDLNRYGAALAVFTHMHDYGYCHNSLLPWHGTAIPDFRFGVELWFVGNIIIIFFVMKED